MQPANFSFVADRNTGLLHVTMSGFFFASDMEPFKDAREKALQDLSDLPFGRKTLLDIRDMHIQMQDIISDFDSLLLNGNFIPVKLAIVVHRPLAIKQATRLMEIWNGRYFSDLEDARSWLMEEDATVSSLS